MRSKELQEYRSNSYKLYERNYKIVKRSQNRSESSSISILDRTSIESCRFGSDYPWASAHPMAVWLAGVKIDAIKFSELANKLALKKIYILAEMSEVELYKSACEYVFKSMPENVSIVNSSIVAAIDGNYSNYHSTPRTQRSQLWINPLMSLYWCFQLIPVADRLLYLDAIEKTNTYQDLMLLITGWESRSNYRQWQDIPV